MEEKTKSKGRGMEKEKKKKKEEKLKPTNMLQIIDSRGKTNFTDQCVCVCMRATLF